MPDQTCDWYLINCLTHLHAGRGDTNYDIVDKEVQRDPISDLPIVHASSLKGALREWFRQQLGDDHPTVNTIFGNDSKRNQNQELKQGSHQFFEARLLALPVRSSHLPYFLATSKEALTDCLSQLPLFGIAHQLAGELLDMVENLTEPSAGQPVALTTATLTDLFLDEYNAGTASPVTLLKTLLGYEHIALFHHNDFKDVAGRLPVIARNNLENGRSINLWYEEIVPRQTRFSFFVRHPATDDSFATTLLAGKSRVQIGANATIGYGQCVLTRQVNP